MELTQDEVRKYWHIFGSDILRDVDGYFVYWPVSNKGSHSAHSLSILIQLLNLANYQWDQQVKKEF